MAETDAVLLRRSRRDPDAFVEVCRRHSDALAGWLGAQLRDDGLACELLAETLAEAWFARGCFRDPGDGGARPWLFGIAKNLVRRTYRDRAIERRARLRLRLPVPEDAAADVLDPAPVLPAPDLAKAQRRVALTLTRPFATYGAGDAIAIWTAPNHGGGTCIMLGRADTDPVARDVLHAVFGGDAFLAELPPSPRPGKGPGPIPGAPYRVVGYDGSGNEVASAALPGR